MEQITDLLPEIVVVGHLPPWKLQISKKDLDFKLGRATCSIYCQISAQFISLTGKLVAELCQLLAN